MQLGTLRTLGCTTTTAAAAATGGLALVSRLLARRLLRNLLLLLAFDLGANAGFRHPASLVLGRTASFDVGLATRFFLDELTFASRNFASFGFRLLTLATRSFFASLLSSSLCLALRFGLRSFLRCRFSGSVNLGLSSRCLSLSRSRLRRLRSCLASRLFATAVTANNGLFDRLRLRLFLDLRRLRTRARTCRGALGFQRGAIEIRLLATYLDVHHARTPLRRGDFDFALRLALECDLGRRGRTFRAPMRAPQERQQFHFRVVADQVIRAGHLNSGFIELRQQALDRYFQYLGKLANSHIRHTRPPAQLITTPLKLVDSRSRTSAYAPP